MKARVAITAVNTACRNPQKVEIPSTASKNASAIVVGLTPVKLRPTKMIAKTERVANA